MTVAANMADRVTKAGQRLHGQVATCTPIGGQDVYRATVVYSSAYTRKSTAPATMMPVSLIRPCIEVRLLDCPVVPRQSDVWTLDPDPSQGLPATTSFTVTEKEPMDAGCVRLYLEEVIA